MKNSTDLAMTISSGVAIYEAVDHGEDFIIKSFNQHGLQIARLEGEDLNGRRIKEVFPGAEASGLLAMIQKAWKTGEPVLNQVYHYTDQRMSGWQDNSVYKLATGDVLSIFNDVTSQIEVERRVKRFNRDLLLLSESAVHFEEMALEEDIFGYLASQLSAMAEGALVLISLYNPENETLKLLKIFGEQDLARLISLVGIDPYQVEAQITSSRFLRMLPPGKLVRVKSGLHGLSLGMVAKDRCQTIEKEMNIGEVYAASIIRDGVVFGCACILTKDGQQLRNHEMITTFLHMASVAIHRRQTLIELRERDQIFQSFIEQSFDGISLIDEQGRITVWNSALEQFTGCPFEDVQGKPAWDVMGNLPRSSGETYQSPLQLRKQIESMLRTGSLSNGSTLHMMTISPRTGSNRVVQSIHFPIHSECGYMIGGISRDITLERQHQQEMEVIIEVNKALRTLTKRSEILHEMVNRLERLLQVSGAAITTYDTVYMEHRVDIATGIWEKIGGSKINIRDGFTVNVVESGEPYINNSITQQNCERVSDFDITKEVKGVVCIPLNAEAQVIGTIWVARDHAIKPEEIRLIKVLGDIAASALQRAGMYEMRERRLEHISALRTIDQTIATSLDLRSNLCVLLDQVVSQLKVDAASVLLFNAITQTLEYGESRGFLTPAIQQSSIRLGQGQPGRAAMDGQMIFVPDLTKSGDRTSRHILLEAENFISYFAIPLIAKGEQKGVLELFHRSRLNPDKEWMRYLDNLSGQAAILIDNWQLYSDLQRSNMELKLAYTNTLEGWVRALDLRDQETEGHTKRVTEMTLRLASFMSVPAERLVHIYRGALLHDIGKMAVPDSILRKPGALTREELKTMRQHPKYAYDLLQPISYLEPAIEIPYCHHERWDGSGYPRGLKEKEIPISARIFAIVDVWDALRSDRPYRKAWSDAQVVKYLRAHSNEYFDPQVVNAFLEIIPE